MYGDVCKINISFVIFIPLLVGSALSFRIYILFILKTNLLSLFIDHSYFLYFPYHLHSCLHYLYSFYSPFCTTRLYSLFLTICTYQISNFIFQLNIIPFSFIFIFIIHLQTFLTLTNLRSFAFLAYFQEATGTSSTPTANALSLMSNGLSLALAPQ